MRPLVLEHILDGRLEPTNLPLGLLTNITDNFSEEREIGHGGFATVYKAVLPNGIVAVKRIRNSHTIEEKLFYREVNSLLTINHPNIVRFLGFCASTDLTAIKIEGKCEHIYAEIRERLLCFEYISNGNLQKHITDELRGLDWGTRYQLIKGICDGLHYLHMEKRIYHMDLKPANILLDNDMVPKITDFGLARLDEKSQTMSVVRHGTPGYCAPEYLCSGKMSFKSDIYSLGTIIIELVTGYKSIPDNSKNNVLRRWCRRWKKTGKGNPLGYQQVTKCIDIGIACQEIDPCKRPFIQEIVRDINEMEGTNSLISNDNESQVGQISPYMEDDMLGIEPLELHFSFEINKEVSCSLELANETDSYIAFEVQKMRPLPYSIEPHRGIVLPCSKCGVDITLQPQDKAPQRANEFIVRSTKVAHGLTAEDITTAMFSRDTGNVVDEVNLDVVFDQRLQVGSGSIDQKGSQYYGDKQEKSMENLSLNKPPSSNMKEVDEWMANYSLVGREPQMNALRRYTAAARFNDSQVISVWGLAGIGKSALVRNLYYDRMLHSNQFDKYIWVDTSHPFHLRDFCRSLISNQDSGKDPIKECRELLCQHRCLVVIDDIRYEEEWDLIQSAFVSRSHGSIVIVIMTEANIATYCANNQEKVFNVKGLEANAAMDLFRKEVRKRNPACPLYNHKITEVEQLILKCGGLPKVIVSMAALLATQTVTLMDVVRSLNDKFMHNLETNPEYYNLQSLFSWMYNYLRNCPDSLKPCIFYLSIFPRGHSIRQRRLVRRWIAEGYSRDSEEESAVDKGENLFLKLLDMGIIQQIPQLVTTAFSDTRRMASFQVNGFIHEYIVSRGMEQNFVTELGPNWVSTTQHIVCHLIILNSWDRDIILFASINLSRLLSLTVLGRWESFFISKNMMQLLVLDLEDASGVTDDDLVNITKLLRVLKFLSLRGCRDIFHLPSSLGNLMQLQTLDVRHTSIITLPASIGKLRQLQYVRAGINVPGSTPPASSCSIPVGVKVPRGIEKLTALHTLGVVNVGASGAIVEELKKLTQLRKLGVSGINNKDFFFKTSGLVHLESLSVQLDNDSHGCLDDISLPWENLQSLKLYGLQDMLPLRNPLRKLRKLDLEIDTLQKSGMEFLAKLPELCILHLRVKQLQLEDGKLYFHAQMYAEELETFKNVKILEVTCRSSRLHVIFGSKSMKNLELLKIDCSSAAYRLTGLDYLPELKEVLIEGTNDEEIKTHLENQLANHPKAPTVKLAGLQRWY